MRQSFLHIQKMPDFLFKMYFNQSIKRCIIKISRKYIVDVEIADDQEGIAYEDVFVVTFHKGMYIK